ncbi:hypothetical protein CYMTET_52167 [Cymbomonas tetramitiformis]|uniref:DUF7869 domain-containing protein n=1 Tax=Cymbomonas tetramitiformis TaxID=36881 RepID=A0AAE0BL04_9CHLO|nr:hypothetical protein CYMTET_52167 [Cymbomonas tetramitiformis]
MDPASECRCGRRCLSQFEYRPVQAYLREKSTLNGRQFKENIVAELTRARRFKPGSQKLEIEMFDSLTFLGKKVCKDAFRRLHFIPESTWFKWHAHVCGGGMLESTMKRNLTLYNDPTNLNWTYFLEYAAHELLPLAEPQPQNGKLQMNPIRPADCYAAYKLMRRGVYQRRAVKDLEDLEDWKTLNDAHRSDYRNERAQYNNTRADSANQLGISDSYCFDGAANNNTVCPHFPVKVKAMSDKAGSFFHLHLQAVVMHGTVLCMCLLMPWVPGKDVNMCLTTLNILLRYVVENTERHFRQTCHVQMDGGSENWNRHVIAFFCILVHHGLYKEIYLHRLPVGHSHNDVDGFFGLLKMLLWGKTADKKSHWFISLEQWIAFLFAWTITTINKHTYVVGCNLDFKSWIDPHLNEEFGGHAGRDRKVHTWCFYVAPDKLVRAKYKFGDRFKEWLPSGVDEDPNLGLIICTSYPDVDSAPGYMDNPEWKRKGKGNKVLDMEQTTRSCLLGLRAATPDLVSQQRHEELKATFPLPLKVEAVRERHPERLPPKWDLSLLLTRAHTRASTVKCDGILKTRYAKAEQFNVCFDGVTHKKQVVEKEVLKNNDINEVVAFMREAKYCTELISRRYEDKHLHRVLSERNAELRGLTTKTKKLERLIQLLKAEDAGEEAPAVRAEAEEAAEEAPAVRAEAGVREANGKEESERSSTCCSQEVAARKKKPEKQPKQQKQPSSSEGTDDGDDEHSSGVDESLYDRGMRLASQKEHLAADYRFEDMTVGSYAVTVAGGEASDKCWFNVMLPDGGKSPPLHFVEVVGQHASRKEITWQFWLPAQSRRTFETVEQLCEAGAFVRGARTLRMKSTFDVNEVLTCWDETAKSGVQGGIPGCEEKAELLKALLENSEE